jgi:hypothetical protein
MELREYVVVKGLPCVEEIHLRRNKRKIMDALDMVGERGFLLVVDVKESGIHIVNFLGETK